MAAEDNYNSNIKDHWSQITRINIIIMKKFEILQELPKRDTGTWSEQMLLGKWYQQTCLMHHCHKPSICKKMHYMGSAIKQTTIKWGVPVLQLDAVTDWDFGLSLWRKLGRAHDFRWQSAGFWRRQPDIQWRCVLCHSVGFPGQGLPLLPCCFETGPYD